MCAHRAPRRPVLPCALGFCAGAGVCASGLSWFWVAASVLALALVSLLVRVHLFGLTIVLLFGVLGFLSFQVSRAPESSVDLRFHQDSQGQIIFYGRTEGEADVRPHETRWIFTADSVAYPDSVVRRAGRVLARFRFDPGIPAHSAVKLAGRLVPPDPASYPGDFSWADYLNRKNLQAQFEPAKGSPVLVVTPGARGFLHHLVVPLRKWIQAQLGAHLEGEERALALGLLLGERSELSPQTIEAFQRTGTLHLLAVSGSNVGVVVAMIWSVLGLFRVGRLLQLVCAAACTVLFCYLAHLEPSVVRAGGAALLVLVAVALRRRVDPIQVWASVLLAFLVWEPSALLDVGFQLSFAATLGILLLPSERSHGPASPLLRIFRMVRLSLLISTAAQLGTLTVLLAVFHELPLVTPLANLVCVPLAGCATLGTLVVILLAPFGEPLAAVASAALWAGLKALLWAVHATFHLAFPVLAVPRPGVGVLLLVASTVLALFAAVRRPLYSRSLIFGGLLASGALLLGAGRAAPPEVVVLDAQNPSALVRLSSGECWWLGDPRSCSTTARTAAHSLGWKAPHRALCLQGSVEPPGENPKTTTYYTDRERVEGRLSAPLTIWCDATDSLPFGVVLDHEGRQLVLCSRWPAEPWDRLGLDSSALWILDGLAPRNSPPPGPRYVTLSHGRDKFGPTAVQELHTGYGGYARIRFHEGRFQSEPCVR